MRKRLDLASALIHNPRLLFLDEPTTGLDAQSRTAIWEYLEDLNRKRGENDFPYDPIPRGGRSALPPTLDYRFHGKLIANGSPLELKEAMGGDTIALTLDPSVRAKTKEILKTVKGISDVLDSNDGVMVCAENGGEKVIDVVTTLDRNGIHPSFLSISSPTLDDVFLKHTGRRIRSEELKRKETEPFLM